MSSGTSARPPNPWTGHACPSSRGPSNSPAAPRLFHDRGQEWPDTAQNWPRSWSGPAAGPLVHPRLAGQTEDALADNAALDLVGTALQPAAGGAEDRLGPRARGRLPG